jgi:hypothetical protein
MLARVRKQSWFDLGRHNDDEAAAAAAAAAAKAAEEAAAAAKAADEKAAADAAAAKAAEKKLMSQADIDKIVEARLVVDRKKVSDYDELKAKAKELDELKAASASEQEKAVKAAEDKATASVTQRYADRLAAAEIKAALTGIVDEPEKIVEDLNLAKFTKDGEVDADAVAALKEKYAGFKPAGKDQGSGRPKGDKGQGAGGDGGETDFRKASKEDVDAELRKLGVRPRR